MSRIFGVALCVCRGGIAGAVLASGAGDASGLAATSGAGVLGGAGVSPVGVGTLAGGGVVGGAVAVVAPGNSDNGIWWMSETDTTLEAPPAAG
jgi:hypothetical protein